MFWSPAEFASLRKKKTWSFVSVDFCYYSAQQKVTVWAVYPSSFISELINPFCYDTGENSGGETDGEVKQQREARGFIKVTRHGFKQYFIRASRLQTKKIHHTPKSIQSVTDSFKYVQNNTSSRWHARHSGYTQKTKYRSHNQVVIRQLKVTADITRVKHGLLVRVAGLASIQVMLNVVVSDDTNEGSQTFWGQDHTRSQRENSMWLFVELHNDGAFSVQTCWAIILCSI